MSFLRGRPDTRQRNVLRHNHPCKTMCTPGICSSSTLKMLMLHKLFKPVLRLTMAFLSSFFSSSVSCSLLTPRQRVVANHRAMVHHINHRKPSNGTAIMVSIGSYLCIKVKKTPKLLAWCGSKFDAPLHLYFLQRDTFAIYVQRKYIPLWSFFLVVDSSSLMTITASGLQT